MTNYKYSLEKYQSGGKNRYNCPSCNQNKVFVRYIDNISKEYIDITVGKCNRIEKCGYHKTPYEYLGNHFGVSNIVPTKVLQTKPTFYCNEDLVIDSLQVNGNNRCNLFKYFTLLFHEDKVSECFNKYFVGSSNKFPSATIFWQLDTKMAVRCGKTMLYNFRTGKRNKAHFSWLRNTDELTELRQVFFGVHLINYFPDYSIGIVESEKTAMLCDLFFEEKIVWTASGGLQGLTENKFNDLHGREVILFPDLSSSNSKNSAVSLWEKKAKEIGEKLNLSIKINYFLEKFATEVDKENQEDLGDFIIKQILKKNNC